MDFALGFIIGSAMPGVVAAFANLMLVVVVLALLFAIAGIFAGGFSSPPPRRLGPGAPYYDSRMIQGIWRAMRQARKEAVCRRHPVLFLAWTTGRMAVLFSPLLIVAVVVITAWV